MVLPRGDSHVLHSSAAAGTDVAPDGDGCILCGAFVVREHEHPVLAALPHVIASRAPGSQPRGR